MNDLDHPDFANEGLETVPGSKDGMMPMEVVLVTADHEVRGLIYVSRDTKPERRLTQLLNDQSKRFLSIIDAELVQRHTPSSPRRYSFLQIHMDNILMIHPATEQVMKRGPVSTEDTQRLDELRAKMSQKQP